MHPIINSIEYEDTQYKCCDIRTSSTATYKIKEDQLLKFFNKRSKGTLEKFTGVLQLYTLSKSIYLELKDGNVLGIVNHTKYMEPLSKRDGIIYNTEWKAENQ